MFRRGQLFTGAFALALVTNAAWSCGGGEPATASSSASSGALGGDPSLGGAGGVAMSGGSGGAMSQSGGLGGTAQSGGAGGTGAGGANAGGAGSGGAPPLSTLLAANVQVVMTGTGTAFARAVAVDPSDAVIVAGTFSGSIDFGGGPITSNGDDVFVAKYDDNGNHLWSNGYGDGQPDNVGGIACDAAGNIILTGSFLGQLGFGGALLNASGNQFSDVYVAKLDALGGHVWSKRFGDLDSQEGHDVAVGPSNEIVITGLFGSNIDFGGPALSTNGDRDAFLVKLDAAGNHVFSKQLGDAAQESGLAVAVSSTGAVAVGGYTEGDIDLGGGNIVNAAGKQAFFAQYDGAGAFASGRVLVGGASSVEALAFDPSGALLAAGNFVSAIDLGQGNLTAQGANDDVFVARYDAAAMLIAGSSHGDAGADKAHAIASDVGGALGVVGRFTGQVAFDDATMVSAGSSDGYAVRLGAAGHAYRSFGDGAFQSANGVAFDSAGRLAVAGDFSGSVDFGLGAVSGSLASYLVIYTP